MPPVIIWALSAIGAVVVAKWLVRGARRVNSELHPGVRAPDRGREDVRSLEQDPETGIYRPK